jgi:hypothetical protein
MCNSVDDEEVAPVESTAEFSQVHQEAKLNAAANS